MRWLAGITDSMHMSLSELWEIMKDREAWHAAVHGVTQNQSANLSKTVCEDKYPWVKLKSKPEGVDKK